jgi:hypothetical protein
MRLSGQHPDSPMLIAGRHGFRCSPRFTAGPAIARFGIQAGSRKTPCS